MDKFTLKNADELEEFVGNKDKPETFKEITERQILSDSLKDTGVDGFKEITNINDIVFGHFIVIEKILGAESLDMEAKIKMVSPYLLRPIDEDGLDNTDIEREKLHITNVEDIPLGSIYGAFNRFSEIRQTYLFKTYNGVIYGALDEDDDDEEDKDEGTSTNSGQSAREFHSKKFFWNSMISVIANGDIFKFNEAVDLKMSTVMPFLAEKRSLEIVEYLEQKARLQ